MSGSLFSAVVRAVRSTAQHELEDVQPDHTFVEDLGFDSMGIVMLGIALEEELEEAVLLDGWIARNSDPRGLTVGSLVAYLEEVTGGELRRAV